MTSVQAVLSLLDALEALSIPYMVVGSLSSNVHGVPRSTQDADLVVQLEGDALQRLAQRLALDFRLDPQMSFETVTGTARYVLKPVDIAFKVELFLLSADPHDRERFARRRRLRIVGRAAWVASSEDVIITKLRWSHLGKRTKDVEDVRNVLAVQGDRIDWPYVYSWCDRHGTHELLEQIRGTIPPI